MRGLQDLDAKPSIVLGILANILSSMIFAYRNPMKFAILLFASGFLASFAADLDPKEFLREGLTYPSRTLAAFDQRLAAARAAGLTEADTVFAELSAGYVYGDLVRMKSALERIDRLKLPEPPRGGGMRPVSLANVRAAVALAEKNPAAAARIHQSIRADAIRAYATITLEDLRQIDSSIDQCAIENSKRPGAVVTWDELRVYLKKGNFLERTGGSVFGDSYGQRFIVGTPPSVPAATWEALEGMVPVKHFVPFPVAGKK